MEQLYQRFFAALPIHAAVSDEDLHLLNPQELRLVRQTERWAMLGAVLIELAAYTIIFLPIYEFPDFFASATARLGGPFTHLSGEFFWLRDGWMLAVTVVELYVLLLLNLAAVHGIAVATGYLRRRTQISERSELIRIALGSEFTELQHFGINPFEGMNPWVLYAFLGFNRFKGLIGGVIIRAVLVNVFGREILRVYLDFSGMPLYMAINAYTTYLILRNSRVVIMGEASIESLCRQLPTLSLSGWESELVYDTLQFIAVNKRDYHANHYHLTKAVLGHFAIPAEASHPLPVDFPAKLKTARQPVADVCKLIIVLGFVLDGSLSWRERRQLARLNQQGILQLSYAELEAFRLAFVEGRGLDAIAGHWAGKTETA